MTEAIIKARKDYAEQIMKYADAIVGLDVVQTLGFCYKLIDSEFARSIISAPIAVVLSIIMSTAIYMLLLLLLSQRQIILIDTKDDPELLAAKRFIQIGRYAAISALGVLDLFAYFYTICHP